MWASEITRAVLFALAAMLAGWLFGHPLTFLLVATLLYLAYQLRNLRRLEYWLRDGHYGSVPDMPGVWGDIFYHIHRMWRRDRKRKRRLADLLKEFRSSTAAMPDGTVVLNRLWEIEWFNDAARRLLGLRQPQDIGQRIGNLLRHPDFIQYLSRGEYDEPVQIPAPGNDQQRLSLKLVPYGVGQRLLLVRDVTRLHELEQMRREFVANASHELRSPLTVLTGYLEAMRDDAKLNEEWEGPLTEMQRQAERMRGIVQDLLELSRLESGGGDAPMEVVDVPGMLARVREAALALGYGPQEVKLRADAGLHLMGAEAELYSAFSNIVFNAMKFTSKDGRVDIRWYRDGEEACLAVSDTGRGIAAEHLPRITERFYRVDKARQRALGGTGLGLAIVKHALQRHNGQLEVSSVLGRGSEFICRFKGERIVTLPDQVAASHD